MCVCFVCLCVCVCVCNLNSVGDGGAGGEELLAAAREGGDAAVALRLQLARERRAARVDGAVQLVGARGGGGGEPGELGAQRGDGAGDALLTAPQLGGARSGVVGEDREAVPRRRCRLADGGVLIGAQACRRARQRCR